MRVVHCPPNEDPLTYAQRAKRRRSGGLAGLLQGNGLLFALIVAMIVGTFTIGPLRPKQKAEEAQQVQATPVSTPAVYVTPVLCKLPGGGMIEAGWESLVQDGEQVIRVRCQEDGTLQATETATD